MNLINKDFTNSMPCQYFTENVALFLYSVLKSVRPKRILEVGAGYTTLFLARAIKDIQEESIDTSNSKFFLEYAKSYTGKDYNPSYTVVDNGSLPEATKGMEQKLKELQLSDVVKIQYSDINAFLRTDPYSYDFMWLDVGNGANYLNLFNSVYNRTMEGGYIVVHSTETNVYGRLFLAELKLRNYNNYELLTFLEPHKKMQNSFTVIRKYKNVPIYTEFA